MRIVVLSDAHLTGPNDPAQADLLAFLADLRADRVVFGGDVFHAWWGWPTVQPRYAPVVAAIAALRDRGVAVTWIPGNHDFALGPVLRPLVEIVPVFRVSIGGLRWQIAHGDEGDGTPSYRLTRRLLRGRPFAAAMRALGPSRGERLLDRLAGASRDHGGPPEPLVAGQRAWARERLAGCDAVALGHSHALGVVTEDAGAIVHLGDWGAQRSWLELTDAGATLWARGAVVGRVPAPG